MQKPKLIIVVPCYNEQEMLDYTTRELSAVIARLKNAGKIGEGKILYVDDGSKDTTWSLIEKHSKEYEEVCGLKLAHNVGHQNALWAGLEWASVNGDMSVSIDADLQDDTNCIDEMVDLYKKGIDIVYGVRKERKTDSVFKRQTALFFYRLVRSMGEDMIYNHADFRLMSQRALKILMAYPERNIFLRGIVPKIGLSTACVYYDRKERIAGESKYPLKKMLAFATDGITSFSIKPIRFITTCGILIFGISILMLIYFLAVHFMGRTVAGWTSMIVSIWAIGGLQLLAIGIVGEYIGKIYLETKDRPKYIIETVLDN